MAQAFKCDRCGKYFDQLPIRAVTGKIDRENYLSLTTGTELANIKILHLCLECHQQLVEWFDMGHEKEEKDE